MTILDACLNNYFQCSVFFHSFHSKTKRKPDRRGIIIESRRFLVRERCWAAEKREAKQEEAVNRIGYSRVGNAGKGSRSQIGGERGGRGRKTWPRLRKVAN